MPPSSNLFCSKSNTHRERRGQIGRRTYRSKDQLSLPRQGRWKRSQEELRKRSKRWKQLWRQESLNPMLSWDLKGLLGIGWISSQRQLWLKLRSQAIELARRLYRLLISKILRSKQRWSRWLYRLTWLSKKSLHNVLLEAHYFSRLNFQLIPNLCKTSPLRA